MLYTRKGDSGTTKTFGAEQRVSKGSHVAETLGSLDEANSFLGLCKARAAASGFRMGAKGKRMSDMAHELQETLFTVQAEVAGAKKTVQKRKVTWVERITDAIEAEIPPIRSFSVPGGTELSACFDVARTLARRAERRVVAAHDENLIKVGTHTLAFLNRLSSVLFALARLANYKAGVAEKAPRYR